MLIGGLQKLSLVDYPGKTSIAIFTIGCNMRCGFCHNAELVMPEQFVPAQNEKEVLDFIKSRVGLIESVTISGGEPTLQPDLDKFIAKVKKLGFLIKLDTNGTQPKVLEKLLRAKLLDFVAMDIKSSPEKYHTVVNRPINIDDVKQSIKLIKKSGVDYEFRTTVVSSLHNIGDFDAIGELISQGGKAKRYALQHFRPAKTLDPKYAKDSTFSDEDFAMLAETMQNYAEEVVIHWKSPRGGSALINRINLLDSDENNWSFWFDNVVNFVLAFRKS